MPQLNIQQIKDALSQEWGKTVTWMVAFIGVCVLVAIDKLKPETVEYMLFALGGALAQKPSIPPSSKDE